MSHSERTATSVVPPPMSTTMEPDGVAIGKPTPSAAAIGSAINPALRQPAARTDWRIARRSTDVAPCGTQTIIRGLMMLERR